ncbi:DNA_pol_E_B domain-containing protein/Pol_alpha_B_N domain-containing protein [Cephalotus follicularis]|uniref:DNA polymerase alpha subunit B n=1 Tax=Cephalotus follicularis TaxID=3775 RepID=A0A1Q3DDM5_CEPFO|nr:DNA_pol_E_B domain-containing protein/Pol_alpha_B_N domain-containing protein [Cephalotus follicularis]
MEEEIKAQFNKSGFTLEQEEEEEILKKCLTFCINYNLNPSDLVSSWEVYYLNRQINESTVQNAEMDGLFMHLQNQQKEALIKDEPGLHIYSSRDVDMILNDEDDSAKEVIPGTPTDKRQSLYSEQFDSAFKENHSTGKPSKLVTPFGKRTNKFVVKFSINNIPNAENVNTEHDHENPEDDIIKRVQPRKRCSLIVLGSGPKPGCRFMYDRIEDKFNALEKRIKKHANALVTHGLFEEPMDPTVASQRSIFAVGMICCDGEGHLNEKSILLQSSAEHSGGQRVRLDLHKLSQFYLFPGQVVGIEGQNPSGHCMIASKLIDSIPFSVTADKNLHPAKKVALGQQIQSADVPYTQKEISMIIASGPFTTIDNLLFEPLTELLAYASRKLPLLLVMLGPFIDSEHPEIKKGTTDRSFDEIFRLEILQRLQDHAEYMGSDSRVILVPSIRDANHELVFPQPAFDIDLPDLKYQITSLSNPGNFEANGVKVGCCTVDVIKQLGGEEIARNSADGAPSDRISRLASHILNQRSFYPLYPPAEIVPLDFSLAPEALDISSIPDILIIPSDMKYFIKVLSLGGKIEGEEPVKCICINPGRLAKGEGGGTFIELNYQGSHEMMNASIIGI